LRGEAHNDVTKFAFGVVGFVFAFFIGFVVSAMWGRSMLPRAGRGSRALLVFSSPGI
jgi:hypothetical protein